MPYTAQRSKNYKPLLGAREVESAIKDIKDFFERNLAEALGLQRVSAPMFVRAGTGVNDDLNAVELPVRFRVKNDANVPVEIVQSLAKWKRLAPARYDHSGAPRGVRYPVWPPGRDPERRRRVLPRNGMSRILP